MSSYPLVKFVDSPATSAVVRYDCNDQAATPAKKVTDFDPGVPTLEGDPDAVGQQWGFRSPRIVHTIKGTKAQAMAALSLVSRELLRRTNWVMFQPSAATQPIWFKTYRTGYEPIKLDRVFVRVDGGGTVALPDTWEITIPLMAESFAYGARVTMSTFQVIQSPADLAGPTRTAMHVVLPAIKGDAPTGLRVTVTPAAGIASGSSGQTWMVGCISGETTLTDPVINIGAADGFTAGSGTGGNVPDANFFSGDYRLVTIGAGAGNLLSRLTGPLVTVPAGRYKVLIRCETAVVPAYYTFQLGRVFTAGNIYGPVITGGRASSVFRGWVDLGEHTFPFGTQTPLDVTAAAPVPSIDLKIGTSDASAGSVKIDAFKLIPVDGRTVNRATLQRAVFNNKVLLLSNVAGTFDADTESYWSTTGGVLNETVPSLYGQSPIADPAADKNLLVVMALYDDNGASASVTSVGTQCAVDVSYYPRYLHVGDGT